MKPGMFSTKRRRILLLAAVGVMAALFFLWPRGPREPVYQGKRLTQWINQANTEIRMGASGRFDRIREEARTALAAIGTNALPFLLNEFTRPISPWRTHVSS